jgi:hypothetical protein
MKQLPKDPLRAIEVGSLFGELEVSQFGTELEVLYLFVVLYFCCNGVYISSKKKSCKKRDTHIGLQQSPNNANMQNPPNIQHQWTLQPEN